MTDTMKLALQLLVLLCTGELISSKTFPSDSGTVCNVMCMTMLYVHVCTYIRSMPKRVELMLHRYSLLQHATYIMYKCVHVLATLLPTVYTLF